MDYHSKTVLNTNYSNTCRCCLIEDGLHDMSTKCIDSEITYEAMLKYTFNIKLTEINNTNTELLCGTCTNSLRNAYIFKDMVNNSEQKILKYLITQDLENDVNILETEIKVEPFESGETTDDASEIDDQNDSFDDDELLANMKVELEQEPEEAAILNPQKRKRALKRKTKSKKLKRNEQNNEIVANGPPKKDWPKITEHRGEGPLLRDNSLKLIENSNLCVFQWNKSWYQCFCCKEMFPDIDGLKDHTSDTHSLQHIEKKIILLQNKRVKVEISNLHCKLCEEKLENTTTLKSHLSRTHSIVINEDLLIPFKLNGSEWNCQICFEKFPGFRLLNIHMNKHYPNQICHICGKSFSHLAFLNLHKTRSHRSNDCKSCKLVFDNKLDRKQHDITVHGVKFERKKRFPCPYCSERFFQENLRVLHTIEAHGMAKPDLRCDICSKQFLTRSLVNSHVKNVHNKEKNKECDVCHNFFYTKSDLRRHIVKHTGEKKFSCESCNTFFATRDSLRRHMKRTHVSIN